MLQIDYLILERRFRACTVIEGRVRIKTFTVSLSTTLFRPTAKSADFVRFLAWRTKQWRCENISILWKRWARVFLTKALFAKMAVEARVGNEAHFHPKNVEHLVG